VIYPVGTLISFLIAVSFAAGLNVYATTAVLGILQRVHWIQAPAGLDVLSTNTAIAASVVLFLVEMFGDKIPYVDLVWNAVHTCVRIPVAALMAYRATASLPPELQILVTVLAGLVAGVAHGTKSGARLLVSASPEPVTNIGFSAVEDALAIGLTWVATKHPYVAGGAAVALVVGALVVVRKIVRALRCAFSRLQQRWSSPAVQI
jgi:hypothetical protein